MSKVLLVEDDETMMKLYQDILERAGFAVTGAWDGLEGLAEAQKNPYDLIVLDIMMPKMNGMEVLKKLKEDPQTKEIPVIILTNLVTKENAEEALNLGAAKFIVKTDYDPDQVVNMIKEVVE